jgi:predicted PurR-regulated permease PerM
MEKKYLVEVSHRTIIFSFFFILLMVFLWQIKTIIFSLVIAFIIMSALKPLVNKLTSVGIPRLIASLVVFLAFIATFFLLALSVFPPLTSETIMLVKNLPSYINRVLFDQNLNIDFNFLSQQLIGFTNSFFQVLTTIFSNLVFIISTLFFGYYFILEEDIFKKLVVAFFDKKQTTRILNLIHKIEKRLGNWFWGELILMTIVGLLTYFGLTLLNMPYALPLSVLAGLLEVVPNLGPVISAIPALIIGLSRDPFLFFATLALYFIIQQLENNLIVPIVMKKAVNLNPVTTLISLLVGGQIAGVLGILLAVPLTVILETIISETFIKEKNASNNHDLFINNIE